MSVRARTWAWKRVADTDLPMAAVTVLLRLADMCKDDTCYYTDDGLAEALRCNTRTVQRARAALVQARLIEVSGGGGRGATTYRLLVANTTSEPGQIDVVEPGQIDVVNPDILTGLEGEPTRTICQGNPDNLSPLPGHFDRVTHTNTPNTPNTPEISGAAVATPAHDEPDPPEKTEPADTPPDDPPAQPERQRSAGELRAIAADGILQALIADLTAAGQVVTRQAHLKPAIGRLIKAHGEDRVRAVFAGVSGVDLGRWPFDGRGIGWLVSGPGFDALANAGRGRHGVTDTGWHRSQDDEDRWWDATPEEQERERAARLADGRRAEEVRHD